MPNGATHQVLGAMTGVTTANRFIVPMLQPDEEEAGTPALVGASLVAGGVGGTVPDLLDPPVHPNHRGLYHSVAMGCLVAGGAVLTLKALRRKAGSARASSQVRDKRRAANDGSGITAKEALIGGALLALLVGVLSHLVADSGTPSGLPLVG